MTSEPPELPGEGQSLLVAVSGGAGSESLVRAGQHLADQLGANWEVIHVEVPDASPGRRAIAADTLGLASRLGATVATLPAATVVDGIEAHLESFAAGHLVLGTPQKSRFPLPWRRSVTDIVIGRGGVLVLHIYPSQPSAPTKGRDLPEAATQAGASRGNFQRYGAALAAVFATLLIAEGLQHFTGTRSLDLLFLLPVIAVAARVGLKPALLSAGLSVLFYNYFLLVPAFSFDPRAPQNLIMSIVLVVVAVYTSMVTGKMRGRLRLSDRSARENASIAALAQRLTRDADWDCTAATVCEYVHNLLGVSTTVFREVDGELVAAAAVPPGPALGPIDRVALDWAWTRGEESGAGTEVMPAADWQFQPLKTSLGVLAVLGLARHDGRSPVAADQHILLSTLVAQAALAHERLRLEDAMRASSPPSVDDRSGVAEGQRS